jgi:hypothetical protein
VSAVGAKLQSVARASSRPVPQRVSQPESHQEQMPVVLLRSRGSSSGCRKPTNVAIGPLSLACRSLPIILLEYLSDC